MAQGSRVCPHCRALNGIEEKACYRCGRALPGPVSSSALRALGDLSADGLPVTKLMAGMCVAVFALCMATDAGRGGLPGLSGFRSATLIRFGALIGFAFDEEPWRLLSAVFVHASLLHIGMNLLGLVNLGRSLEPHFRSARFLLLYVLSGILGFSATMWWRGGTAFTVGASGSLFGVLGATIAVLMVRRNPGWQRVFFSNLILAAALAFMAPAIDNAAHIGGFIAGFLIGMLFEVEPKPRRRDGLMAVLAGLALLACFASVALCAFSPLWKEVQRAQEAHMASPDSE